MGDFLAARAARHARNIRHLLRRRERPDSPIVISMRHGPTLLGHVEAFDGVKLTLRSVIVDFGDYRERSARVEVWCHSIVGELADDRSIVNFLAKGRA